MLKKVPKKKIYVPLKMQWIFLSDDMIKAGKVFKNGVLLVFGVIICEF